jgi:hypothetical protein
VNRYNFKQIEKKWQQIWDEKKNFQSNKNSKKKFYCLEMFPYPIWENSYGTRQKLYYWGCIIEI